MAARNPRYRDLFSAGFSAVALTQAGAALAHIPGAVDKAAVAAINKTMAKGKTRVVRGFSAFLNVKQPTIRRRVFVIKASAKKPFGSIKILGRAVGLINFGAVDKRPLGVSAQIFRGGSPQNFPHAFLAKGKYGNLHAVERVGAPREPLETQFSPRLYDLFFTSPLPADLRAWLPGELDTQLRSQIDRFLAQDLKKR